MDQHFLAAVGRDESIAYIYVDAAGVIRFWNDGAAALFGYDAAQAIGSGVELIIPHSMRSAHGACFAKAMRSGWAGSAGWDAIEGLRGSGEPVAVEVFLTPVTSAGSANGAFAMFRRQMAAP